MADTTSILPVRDALRAVMEKQGVDAFGIIGGKICAVNFVQHGGQAYTAVRDISTVRGMRDIMDKYGPEVELLLRVGADDADVERLDFYRAIRERLIASEMSGWPTEVADDSADIIGP